MLLLSTSFLNEHELLSEKFQSISSCVKHICAWIDIAPKWKWMPSSKNKACLRIVVVLDSVGDRIWWLSSGCCGGLNTGSTVSYHHPILDASLKQKALFGCKTFFLAKQTEIAFASSLFPLWVHRIRRKTLCRKKDAQKRCVAKENKYTALSEFSVSLARALLYLKVMQTVYDLCAIVSGSLLQIEDVSMLTHSVYK